jgi:hypothetical protein
MELPIFDTYINFSCHPFCYFTIAPLFVLDKSTAWNRRLQHPCFKNLCKIAQASKNSHSNTQHFLSGLLTHSWFHSMLFALPGYQFPYNVMNRCFYLTRICCGCRNWRERGGEFHRFCQPLHGCFIITLCLSLWMLALRRREIHWDWWIIGVGSHIKIKTRGYIVYTKYDI